MRPIAFLYFILILLSSLFMSCENEGDNPRSFGQLIGIVSSEDGILLSGAKVEIKSSKFSKTETTTGEGRFNFDRIPIGDYELSVSAESYISNTLSITIAENIVTERNVSLILGAVILEVDKQEIEANINDGVATLGVVSNTSWLATTAAEWITIDKPQGQGDRSLSIIYTANEGSEEREGLIEIKAGEEVRSVKIKQYAPIKIKKITPIYGEQVGQRKAGFEIEYTGPVKDLEFRPIINWCLPNYTPFTINDSRTKITYTYTCGLAGGSFPFVMEYKDDRDNSYTKNIQINYFDEMLNFDGQVISQATVPGKDQVWMLTKEPTRLHFVDLEEFKIVKTISINSDQPSHVGYNPHNQQVYVSLKDGQILVYNSTTGILNTTLQLPPVPYQPDDNYYVHEMAFTTSGKALMEIYQVESSGMTWFILDTQQGNTIFDHISKGWDSGQLYETIFPRSNGMDKNLYFYGIGVNDRGLMKFDEQLTQWTTVATGESDPTIRNMFMDRMSERFVMFDGDVFVVDKGKRIDLGFLGYPNIRVEFCRSCSTAQVLLIHGMSNHLLDFYDYGQKKVLKSFPTGAGVWSRMYHSIHGKYIVAEPNDYEYNQGSETFRGKLVRISLENLGL